jgi:hypothetical protein
MTNGKVQKQNVQLYEHFSIEVIKIFYVKIEFVMIIFVESVNSFIFYAPYIHKLIDLFVYIW